MRKPVRSGGTTRTPTAILTGSPLSRGGTTPGWCKCLGGARVGRHRCGFDGSSQERMSTRSRLSRSAPGWSRWIRPPVRQSSPSTPDMTPSNSAWPWQICRSASSSACVRGVASTLTLTSNLPRGDHGAMGGSLSAMLQRPGRSRARPGRWPIPATDRFACRPGPDCTPSRKTMRRAERAGPGPSCAGRSFGSTSNGCPAPRKLRSRSGFGGQDPRPRTCPRSGVPTSPGSRWSTPSAFSSRPCAGPPPSSAHPALLTGGPGSCFWPTYSSAWHVMW